MTTQIHRPNTVDVDKFDFGEITVNKYGGKSCKIKYEGQDLFVQFPRMRLPYGMSIYEDESTGKKKYSLDHSLGGYELDDDGNPRDQRVRDAFDFLEKLEKKLYETAAKNCDEWLDMAEATPAVAKALCRDLIKYHRDKVTKKITNKYPPTFKSKLGYWEGKFMCKTFNDKKEEVPDEVLESTLTGGTEVVPIIKIHNITFAGGKCGYSLMQHQQKIYTPVRMPSYAFIDDAEDDKPAVASPEEEVDEGNEEDDDNQPRMVQDSDDDEEEDQDELDEEEEEEDEPPPPPKKKKVVKKKK